MLLSFLFFINKKLALPLILLVIVMFVFSFRQNAKMQETFMENRRKIGDVNASLQDTLSGIRVVQSFANEDIERTKFKKKQRSVPCFQNEIIITVWEAS